MDPYVAALTAALQLANTIAQIILFDIQSQPAPIRAEYAKAQWEAFQFWRGVIERLMPKLPPSP